MSAECDKCGWDLNGNDECVLCQQEAEIIALRDLNIKINQKWLDAVAQIIALTKIYKAAKAAIENEGWYSENVSCAIAAYDVGDGT